MIGFEDGIDGVRPNYSSSVPSRVIKESCFISYTCEDIWFYLAAAGRIRNLRFAQFLCDAQKVGSAFDSRDVGAIAAVNRQFSGQTLRYFCALAHGSGAPIREAPEFEGFFLSIFAFSALSVPATSIGTLVAYKKGSQR